MAAKSLDEFIQQIPSSTEIKQQLTQNLREARMLRRLLKLPESRESAQEAKVGSGTGARS